MATKDNSTPVPSGNEHVKQCCARLYESDITRFLLGDSFHPGGLEMTGRLGRMLGLSLASRVLDVACGNGTAAIFLAKEFGCEVFGIDYGDQSVAAARLLAQSEHIDTRVQFEPADAETLPFPDGSFDAVICECAFCTFPNKAASSREFFRVLRQGGHVGISDVTRETLLPEELDGLLAWIACIGDAQTVEGYTHFLQDAGFFVDGIEQQNDALEEMVKQVRVKLLGAEIMTGLNKLQLPGIDLGAAKKLAGSAMAAVKQGQLGYVLICATKPDSR
jgi:arsenite methyltransferase